MSVDYILLRIVCTEIEIEIEIETEVFEKTGGR